MKRECESCIKRKTTYCPTSMECMATDDMPYYQNRIMLLEENQELMKLQNNWNELKNYLEKQIIDSKSASSQQYYFNTIYKLMQELEQGKDD